MNTEFKEHCLHLVGTCSDGMKTLDYRLYLEAMNN